MARPHSARRQISHCGGALDPAVIRCIGRGGRQSVGSLKGRLAPKPCRDSQPKPEAEIKASPAPCSALRIIGPRLHGFTDGISSQQLQNGVFNQIKVDPEISISFALLSVHWMSGPGFSIHNADTQHNRLCSAPPLSPIFLTTGACLYGRPRHFCNGYQSPSLPQPSCPRLVASELP